MLPMIFPAAGSYVWQHTASQDDSFCWRIPVTDEAYEGGVFHELWLSSIHTEELSLIGKGSYTDVYAGWYCWSMKPLFSNSTRFEDVSGLSSNRWNKRWKTAVVGRSRNNVSVNKSLTMGIASFIFTWGAVPVQGMIMWISQMPWWESFGFLSLFFFL